MLFRLYSGRIVVSAILLLFLGLSIFAVKPQGKEDNNVDLITRGKYPSVSSGCGDCHSPKIFKGMEMLEDSTRLMSGHPSDQKIDDIPNGFLSPDKWIAATNAHMTAWAGPWGISYSANLTPDEATGLGAWEVDNFIETIRSGKHLGFGRPVLPPMPWYNYARMSDEDLTAIFAYLMSLPPIENRVPVNIEPKDLKPSGK